MVRTSITNTCGWFPIAIAVLGPTAAAMLYIHGSQTTETRQIVYFVTKILLFSFPIVWWLFIEKRRVWRFFDPHKPKPVARNDLLIGLISGSIIGLFIWAVYGFVLRGSIDVVVLREHVQRFGAYEHFVVYALLLSIVNSGLEEYYWRWFVFGRLRDKIKTAAAIVLSSAAFAAHHFVVLQNFLNDAGLALILSAGVVAGGAIWAYHYHRTGRLRGVWVSHFIVDAAVMSAGYHMLF